MKPSSILLTILFLTATILSGQNELVQIDEKALITSTIETYFEGWMTGDTTKLGAAMHATCQLKNLKDDKVLIFDRATYLGFFDLRPRRKNSGGRIVDINVTGNIAAAKCEIETPTSLYTDYFNLMKIKDQWYIVDKIATSKVKTLDGFYIKWNIDLTQKKIKPSIPISIEEAKVVNCYYVKFDDQNRMTSVKFFLSGKPSNHGSYGAFELNRVYEKDMIIESFKNTEGQPVLSATGIGQNKYYLNKNGFWLKKEYYDLNNKMVEASEVAIVELTRNENNEVESWIRYNLSGDTIPFYNKLKKTFISFDEKGQLEFMQNRDNNGSLENGEMGVAEVAYQYNQNGSLLSKEFRNEDKLPIFHPTLKYSRIEYREFNKYDLPKRFYCIDENGYPMEYGIIEYNDNMTRKKKVYYNPEGVVADCAYGFSHVFYRYNDQGELLVEEKYNLKGERQ